MRHKELPASRGMAATLRMGGLSVRQLARGVAREVRQKRFVGRASELAFDFLFALFPLILFMLTLFGMFASHSRELREMFLSFFADFLPRSAFELLTSTTTELARNAGTGKLTLGIAMALWFASGGIGSMVAALNLTYEVAEERSWIRVRLTSLVLTLAITVLMLAALCLGLASGHFLDLFAERIGLRPAVAEMWKVAKWPVAVVFVTVSYSLIYFFGPNVKRKRWRWITPGAVFGASAWVVACMSFRIYLGFFDGYAMSYGSLGAVMILLAWLYIAGLAFLVGGEINAQVERAASAAAFEPRELAGPIV